MDARPVQETGSVWGKFRDPRVSGLVKLEGPVSGTLHPEVFSQEEDEEGEEEEDCAPTPKAPLAMGSIGDSGFRASGLGPNPDQPLNPQTPKPLNP